MLKEKKKCRKRWRGGLKETIELILIRPPQLQFFEDGIKIKLTVKLTVKLANENTKAVQNNSNNMMKLVWKHFMSEGIKNIFFSVDIDNKRG